MPADTLSVFAACAPGLERFLARELLALGVTEPRVVPGGVEFDGGLRDVYRANLELRLASRVLVRIGHFHAREFWELDKRAARLEWERYLRPGRPVAVRATSHQSRLYHTDAVAERVAQAIAKRLGQPVSRQAAADDDGEAPSHTAPLVVVRLDGDAVTVSVDSSGELLHRRGYRLATAKAPLRETLAAGLLAAAAWDRAGPLLDPFCGSGTIAIEAAQWARGLRPGRGRQFRFMEWPRYEARLWQSLQSAAEAPAGPPPVILASDRDAGAITAARANAERAGVAEAITFARQAVSAMAPPAGPGWVVTNPPYGRRVSSASDPAALLDLYAAFGQTLRERCPGWQVAFLCPEERLARATGLRFDLGRAAHLVNGGVAVTVWQARVAR